MEIISELLELSGSKQSYRCSIVEQPQLEPYWHSHPEIELSLILSGSGLRFVGDHIGKFSVGDLLLTCNNLPHDRVTERDNHNCKNARVAVLHLSPHFWSNFAEFEPVRQLMQRARYGVLFPAPNNAFTQSFTNLAQQSGLQGLATVLQLFQHLLDMPQQQCLSSVAFGEGQFAIPENQRIHSINEYLLTHYQHPISQHQVADKVGMSPQAFSRWFKTIMNCTFIEHLNKIRVEKACLKLLNSSSAISNIAAECGYDSLSHFNRQFLRLKQCSPREFRQHFSTRYETPNQN